MAITERNNQWNKLALECAKAQQLKPLNISPEQARQRQERTYRLNRIALDYAGTRPASD